MPEDIYFRAVSPNTTNSAQAALMMTRQSCDCYLLPVNGCPSRPYSFDASLYPALAGFSRVAMYSFIALMFFPTVYKFDRFSRNKYETAIHKKTLRDNGVKVISATEHIPDSPEGIIFESMLEGFKHSNGHNTLKIELKQPEFNDTKTEARKIMYSVLYKVLFRKAIKAM